MAEQVFYVVVPNPDNERGVRVVLSTTGKIVAEGHLVADAVSYLSDDQVPAGTVVQMPLVFRGEMKVDEAP